MIKVADGIYLYGKYSFTKAAVTWRGVKLYHGQRGAQQLMDRFAAKQTDPISRQASNIAVGAVASNKAVGGFASPQEHGAAFIRSPGYTQGTHYYDNGELVKVVPPSRVTPSSTVMSRRETIPHEAHHTGPQSAWYRHIPGVPFLEDMYRSSERIARFKGGYARPRNAGVVQRLRSGYGAYKDYTDAAAKLRELGLYQGWRSKLKDVWNNRYGVQTPQDAMAKALAMQKSFSSVGRTGSLGEQAGPYRTMAEARRAPASEIHEEPIGSEELKRMFGVNSVGHAQAALRK